jgi:signal transduction histidine kinase
MRYGVTVRVQLSICRRRETLLTLACAGAVVSASLIGWLDPVERPVSDLMLRLPRPGPPPASQFAAVLIDDAAVAAHGPLPWPRARLAELVTRLHQSGARGVIIDLLLTDSVDEASDRALAEAFAAGPTVLAAALAPDGGWILPLPRFGGGRRAAHAHAEVESDGVVRFISSTKQSHTLSLQALAVAGARLAGRQLSIAPGEQLRPDFSHPPDAIPQVGAVQVLSGQASDRLWAGRVVLIGISATGAGDQMLIPVGDRQRPVPGVLVHAAIASSIYHNGLLHRLPWWWTLLIVIGASAAVQALRSGAGRLHPLYLSAMAAGGLAATVGSLWIGRTIVPAVALLLVMVLSAMSREVVESLEAQRQTAAVLASLLGNGTSQRDLPSGVRGRLEMLQQLQSQVMRDRNLRKSLLDGLHEGVVLWDETGELLLANPAATSLWGHPPSLDEITCSGDSCEVEQAGRILEVEMRSLPTGRLGLLRDVTARRALEQRRREMQRLVSHELKTPLASIAGFGNMLERYTMSAAELKRVAALIRGESERLGEMVTTFLDLERIASGHWSQERSLIDLSRLTEKRCQLLAAAAAERSKRIEVKTPGRLMVDGAAQLLSHLVDNLVGNALKYSPEGATVEVSAGDRQLVVTDHGAGIPETALPHLFERFYRVPGARQTGSGLGLALVKEVTDWHRACVSVSSELGKGSRFTVTFPEPEQENGGC